MHETIQFLIQNGYAVLFFWILFEQLGLPIPAAPMLIATGALAGVGRLNFIMVFGVGVAGALLSDFFWFHMGRFRGSKVLTLLCRISLDPDSCVHRTKVIFSRYGAPSLLVAKFIPGMNAMGPPLAGILRMRFLRFLFFDGLGAFIWVSVFTLLGYQFGHEIEEHVINTRGVGPWIGLIVPVGLGVYILWKYIQRKRFLRQLSIARISPEEVKQKLDGGEDILILDLRDALEFEIEPRTIPGSFHLSIEDLEKQHHKIPRDREIILFCT